MNNKAENYVDLKRYNAVLDFEWGSRLVRVFDCCINIK